MVARRDPIERVVDLMVATPMCAYVAARRTLPVVSRLVRRRIVPGAEVGPLPDAATLVADPIDDAEVDRELIEADLDDLEAVAPDRSAAATVTGPLPIENYDHLAARQVVDRLDALRPEELAVVDAYERSHRHRQTVLRKIEQLTS